MIQHVGLGQIEAGHQARGVTETLRLDLNADGSRRCLPLGQNEQPIFMKIPQGRQAGQDGLVCKILKSLYGLKQAERLWNKTIIKFFRKIRFVPTNADPCILIFRENGYPIVLGMYADDVMLAAKRDNAIKWLKDQLIDEFNMKDSGEAKTIIGWENTQDLEVKTLKIDQKAYIRDLLESEGITSCHPTVLPIKAGSSISMDQASDDARKDLVLYQRLIGKLSRHNSNPCAGHLHVAKQVLCYLKGTINLRIMWGGDPAEHLQKYQHFGVVDNDMV